MNQFKEGLNWRPRKTSEQRREELLAFKPTGDELADLNKIMEITAEQPTPYKNIAALKIGDILMMLETIRIKYTAEKEVTLEEDEKLEEIIEFYRLRGSELLNRSDK